MVPLAAGTPDSTASRASTPLIGCYSSQSLTQISLFSTWDHQPGESVWLQRLSWDDVLHCLRVWAGMTFYHCLELKATDSFVEALSTFTQTLMTRIWLILLWGHQRCYSAISDAAWVSLATETVNIRQWMRRYLHLEWCDVPLPDLVRLPWMWQAHPSFTRVGTVRPLIFYISWSIRNILQSAWDKLDRLQAFHNWIPGFFT